MQADRPLRTTNVPWLILGTICTVGAASVGIINVLNRGCPGTPGVKQSMVAVRTTAAQLEGLATRLGRCPTDDEVNQIRALDWV